MFARYIKYLVIGACILSAFCVAAQAGSIWFNYPTNGSTYDTNPGADMRQFSVSWN
jgi:hypothetical protein